jgi:hypothetical protein
MGRIVYTKEYKSVLFQQEEALVFPVGEYPNQFTLRDRNKGGLSKSFYYCGIARTATYFLEINIRS